MALYEVLSDGTIVPKAGKTVGNLDCLRPVLLWENDSPTLSFPQRTIEDITPNNCDYFEIGYRYDTTNNFQKSDLIKADAGVRGLLSFVNTPNIMFARALTINSKTSISFSASYRGNGSSESMDNTTIIPLYVIGYTKEPAMIYTGKELFAGNGISIDDGVISSKSVLVKEQAITSGSSNCIVTGLDIKENEIYDIYINATANAGTDISLQLGQKQAGYRYMAEYSYWYSSSGSVNVTSGGNLSDSKFGVGTIWNYANQYKINLVRIGNDYILNSKGLGMDSGSNYIRDCRGLVNTSEAITSLTFTLGGSTFKSGGKILIFKRV